jgi:hypothetical protein
MANERSPIRPRRWIAWIGVAGLALPAAANVPTDVQARRDALRARVEAVRQGLKPASALPATLLAQTSDWNNWPKWSKWSNWANE